MNHVSRVITRRLLQKTRSFVISVIVFVWLYFNKLLWFVVWWREMSRRKQARPVKLLEEDGVVQTPPADSSAATQNPPTHGKYCYHLLFTTFRVWLSSQRYSWVPGYNIHKNLLRRFYQNFRRNQLTRKIVSSKIICDGRIAVLFSGYDKYYIISILLENKCLVEVCG